MKALWGIVAVFVLLAGCEGPESSSDSHYEQVSREMERLKAESEAAAQTGDNIKVVVTMLSTGVDERFAIDTLWRYADENIAIVKRPEDFSRSGLRIGVGGENFKAGLEITKEQLKSSEESELFIVLADGSSGYINIGREIYVPRFYYFGRWYAGVDYEFRQAGRSLKVTARRLPSGQIDMELTPVFSRFLSDGGDLELTELSTRVIAEAGQSLVIGGGGSSEEDVATALLSYGKYGEKKQTLVTVTPYVR
ncbi:MAG: hypothetical protein ACYS18_07260 [Planctomycetota bacterium]